MFFAAASHVVLVRSSQDEANVRNLVNLSDTGVVGTEKQESLAFVRRFVWGTLGADDAEIVSKSADGLAKMTTVIGTVLVFSRPHGVGK